MRSEGGQLNDAIRLIAKNYILALLNFKKLFMIA